MHDARPHSQPMSTEEEIAILQARGDLAVENRNHWQAEAESLRAQLASARKALEDIAKEVFTDETPTKAARTAIAALKEIEP